MLLTDVDVLVISRCVAVFDVVCCVDDVMPTVVLLVPLLLPVPPPPPKPHAVFDALVAPQCKPIDKFVFGFVC